MKCVYECAYEYLGQSPLRVLGGCDWFLRLLIIRIYCLNISLCNNMIYFWDIVLTLSSTTLEAITIG